MTISIESLLAARLFLSPKLLGNRLFFLSNLGQGGHLSLYAMDAGGSVPEPLLPARIAVPNPELMEAEVFALFPRLGMLLLMLDRDGDENYQPMLIPLEGGIPEPAFGAAFDDYRVRCLESDPQRNLAYLNAESRTEQMHGSFQANPETGELRKLGQHAWCTFDEANLTMKLERVLCGRGKLANGTLEDCSYEKESDRFALSFSTATSPSQIYTFEGDRRQVVRQHTRERVLGLPEEWLSPGED